MRANYRCYFFGRDISSFNLPGSIDAAEDFRAETDDEARIMAEVLYGRRQDQIHGFELWQANRLVHRQPASSIQSRVGINSAKPLVKGQIHER